MRDRIDNSNPLFLIAGNSSLEQSSNYGIALNIQNTKSKKHFTWGLRLNGSVVRNSIVSRTMRFQEQTYLEGWGGYEVMPGTSLTTYENARGAFNVNAALELGKTFKTRNTLQTARLILDGRYAASPMYIQEDFCLLRDCGPSARLLYNGTYFRRLRIGFSGNVAWSTSRNSLGTTLAERWTYAADVMIGSTFLKHAFIDASYGFGLYDYGSGKRILSSNSLGAAAGYRFLDGNLIVCLSGSNLLDSKPSYTLNVTADSRQEVWTSYFGRSVMLRISYRLNTLKKNVSFNGSLKRGDIVSSF